MKDEYHERHATPEQDVKHVQHFAGQFSILVSSGAFAYVGLLALNILLARSLGSEGFGAWTVAFSFMVLISRFGLVGSDWIVLRQGSYYQGVGDIARFRRTLHFALLLSAIALSALGVTVLLLSQTIATRLFHTESLAPLIRIAGVGGPLLGLRQILLSGTQAFKNLGDVAVINNIMQPAVRLLFVAVALGFASSQMSAFVGLFLSEIILSVAAAIALNRRLPVLGPTEHIQQKELIKFALPAWGSRLVETARGELFPIIVGSLAGLSVTGVFVAARRVTKAPTSINRVMNQVYIPMASDLYLQGRRQELATLTKGIGKWVFTFGFPLFLLMVLFPKEILSLFGGSFADAAPVLVLLAIGTLFLIGTGPVTTTLLLSGRSKLALFDYLLVIGTEVGLAFWLIPSWGAIGAAVAAMAAVILNNVLPLLQVWFILGFHVYRAEYWKPTVAGIGAVVLAKAVLILLGSTPGIASAVTAGAITSVAFLVMLLLFGFDAADRAAIAAVIGRVKRRPPARIGTGKP